VGTGVARKVCVASLTEKSASWELATDASGELIWAKDMIFYYSSTANRYQSIPCVLTGARPSFAEVRPLFTDGKSHNDLIYGVTGNPPKYLAQRLASVGDVKSLSLIVNWKGFIGGE